MKPEFSDSFGYDVEIAEERYKNASETPAPEDKLHLIAPFGHLDIIHRSSIHKSNRYGPFHLKHMDMAMQNLLEHYGYSIVVVINREMARTAP
jgi:hypothetical protein